MQLPPQPHPPCLPLRSMIARQSTTTGSICGPPSGRGGAARTRTVAVIRKRIRQRRRPLRRRPPNRRPPNRRLTSPRKRRRRRRPRRQRIQRRRRPQRSPPEALLRSRRQHLRSRLARKCAPSSRCSTPAETACSGPCRTMSRMRTTSARQRTTWSRSNAAPLVGLARRRRLACMARCASISTRRTTSASTCDSRSAPARHRS
mmetsp:Transcript_90778/g.261572  ORF Transcript_90778/g.261572 Transcript_90778/m.261572 type:complete len:203 (-) Transcript_90778:405-1013(-)